MVGFVVVPGLVEGLACLKLSESGELLGTLLSSI